MGSSGLAEIHTTQVILWALLPFVLWARPKWAVVAWLLMGNLDATGPGFATSTVSIGWLNAMKAIVVPLYLCWRLRRSSTESIRSLAARLWMLLIAYAAVASLWAPYPVSAAKLVANMVGILLSVVVFEKAARGELLDGHALIALTLGTLLLGAFQTYYFGGGLYGFDGVDQPVRLSSFVSAQQYAAFLVGLLAAVLWHGNLSRMWRMNLVLLTGLALVLNGSRTWFCGAILVLVLYMWTRMARGLVVAAFLVAGLALTCLVVVNLGFSDRDIMRDTSSRIVETVSAIFAGEDTAHNAGLRNLNFRVAIYEGVIGELRSSSTLELLFGHGTSSGGNVAMKVFPRQYRPDHIDPNRMVHNEWLRSLYEWGVVGFVLFVGVFLTLVVGLVRRHRAADWKAPTTALIAYMPAFLLAISMENVVAGAGNAVTMSFAMLIGMLWAKARVRCGAQVEMEAPNRFAYLAGGESLALPSRT